MGSIDVLWMILWFLVGLFVFQERSLKVYWDEIDSVTSVITLVPFFLGALYGSITLPDIANKYFGSVLVGILSSLVYLIGANISRYIQFRTMSMRIVAYIVLFLVFLKVLVSLS